MGLLLVMVNSVIPLMILLIGVLFYYKAPKKINYIYGYRTSMSMKNQETWRYAHQVCGKMWIGIGLFMSIVTALTLMIFLNSGSNKPSDSIAFLVIVQVGLLMGSILPVEISLRKRFDKDGNERNQ